MAEMQGKLGILIVAFIAILVGVTFLESLADTVAGNDVIDTTNTTVTIASGVGNLADADVTQILYFGSVQNNTDDDSSIAFDTEVNFTYAGRVTVSQDVDGDSATGFGNGVYNITYKNEGVNYVPGSTARSLENLIIIFFVLGILGVAIFAAYRTYPEMFGR